jgi:hypothetical protein
MVHFAGAGGALVGVTHECDYPAGVERLPKLTSSEIDGRRMTSAEIDAAVERYLATPPQPPESMFDHLYATLPPALAEQRAALIRDAGAGHRGGGGGEHA